MTTAITEPPVSVLLVMADRAHTRVIRAIEQGEMDSTVYSLMHREDALRELATRRAIAVTQRGERKGR